MTIVVLGLTITSSWGNGHATTYRALLRALAARGHEVLFLERDVPWYATNRDLPEPAYARATLYRDLSELGSRHAGEIAGADLVIVGSYVPEGVAVGDLVLRISTGVTAFYDLDTPVTLAQLERGSTDYLARRQIPRYDLYLSFAGGPTLDRLHDDFKARRPRPLYCSADPNLYMPEADSVPRQYDLGYLGTYSADRQPMLQRLLIAPAERWSGGCFIVAGPQYPDDIRWPPNVHRVQHLPATEHRGFYNRLRFTLNVTRADMVRAGYCPSVRLFEAAACGTPIISDRWPGIEELFSPPAEILLPRNTDEAIACVRDLPDACRQSIGVRGRDRVLRSHTSAHRARELETFVSEVRGGSIVQDAPLQGARPQGSAWRSSR